MFTAFALIVALLAVVLAERAHRHASRLALEATVLRRKQPQPSIARLEAVELAVSDLEHRHEQLKSSHTRLNARVGMREARERLTDKTPESPEDERAELQKLLAARVQP